MAVTHGERWVAEGSSWEGWGSDDRLVGRVVSCVLWQCPIVERLVCSLMRKGRNNGKKLMAVRIVKHTLEIIHLLTDQNPVQVGRQAGNQAVIASVHEAMASLWHCHARCPCLRACCRWGFEVTATAGQQDV